VTEAVYEAGYGLQNPSSAFLQAAQACRIQVLLRVQPNDAFEGPLKMRRAHARLGCEVFELQGFIAPFLDVTAHFPN
jgi:hypothetical protein